MAVRGSPAKGVGWGDWREGSNPSFSAIYVHSSNVVHVVFFGRKMYSKPVSLQGGRDFEPSKLYGIIALLYNECMDRGKDGLSV